MYLPYGTAALHTLDNTAGSQLTTFVISYLIFNNYLFIEDMRPGTWDPACPTPILIFSTKWDLASQNSTLMVFHCYLNTLYDFWTDSYEYECEVMAYVSVFMNISMSFYLIFITMLSIHQRPIMIIIIHRYRPRLIGAIAYNIQYFIVILKLII